MTTAATIKTVPNFLSFIRIVLSAIMLFIKPLSLGFYIIYIICGISDILDGFIARKTGTSSRYGARLDTIADIIMAAVLLIKVFPLLKLPSIIILWVITIGIVRLVSIIVVFVRFNTFAMLHTYGNKLTGLILFLIPIFLINNSSTCWMYMICIIASLSSVEELLVQLTSKELNPDRKSIIHTP